MAILIMILASFCFAFGLVLMAFVITMTISILDDATNDKENGMKMNKTSRGFSYSEFEDVYGQKCSIQKSSSAFDDCIWLGVDDANPQIMASEAYDLGIETNEKTGHISFPFPKEVHFSTRMHLSRDKVKMLLPNLINFAKTGELVKEK